MPDQHCKDKMEYNYDDVGVESLNDETPQLCQILYSDEYKRLMGTLLAMMKKKEYSERALALVERGIEKLASHYTLWNYRYNIVVNLKKSLIEELDWCEAIALENEKNYQIWNYRQMIIEKISESQAYPAHREYPVMNAMLEEDLKNHHVWLYRKWLVERFELYQDAKEIEFVNKCIEIDIRNNSAWTHRFFLMSNGNPIFQEEVQYVKEKIGQIPQNPSSWNYLLGLYKHYHQPIEQLEPFCLELADIKADKIKCSYALEMLARIYQPAKAVQVYKSLQHYDPIRTNYWNYKINSLSKEHSIV